MTTTALAPRTDFLGLDGLTHLYTAAEGPLLRQSALALEEYAQRKASAEAGRAGHAAVTRAARVALAQLMRVDPGDLAFMASASHAINSVYGLIDFLSGDNVVITDLEFPSVALPLLRLRERGVEVRLVRHARWDITTEALLGAVDGRTRLLAVSHVSYVNGLRFDLEAIAGALRGSGTWLLVDATQSLGVLPVPATAADFLVSSSYKWLLGTHGLGILYWNRARRPDVQPQQIGWYALADTFTPDRFERYALRPDAGRFEAGYLNFPAIYALLAAVEYLNGLGLERLAEHALTLGDRLLEGLAGLDVEVMSPLDRRRRGASISFAHPEAGVLGRALAERGIHVWAGDGRVRASTHLHNDAADVERYLDALQALLRRGA